jgi:hypothetical protein
VYGKNLKLGGNFELDSIQRLRFERCKKRKFGISDDLFRRKRTSFVYLLVQEVGEGKKRLLKIGCSEGSMKKNSDSYLRLPKDRAGVVNSRTGPASYMEMLMREGNLKGCSYYVFQLPTQDLQAAARPVEAAFLRAYRRAHGGALPPLNVIEKGSTWAEVRRALGF